MRLVPPWVWAAVLAAAAIAGLGLGLIIARLESLRPAAATDQPRAVVAPNAGALVPEAQRAARARGLAGQLDTPLVVRFKAEDGAVSPGLTFAWSAAALGGVDPRTIEGYQLLDLATYAAHGPGAAAAMIDWCDNTVYGGELTPALCEQARTRGEAAAAPAQP